VCVAWHGWIALLSLSNFVDNPGPLKPKPYHAPNFRHACKFLTQVPISLDEVVANCGFVPAHDNPNILETVVRLSESGKYCDLRYILLQLVGGKLC
jgi:hypothetical protein